MTMALFAAMIMFLAVIGAVVFVIVSDNKKEIAMKQIGYSKGKKSIENDNLTRVYDGIPIVKCNLCGGRGVIVSKSNGKDILFNARCRDCGRTLCNSDGGPDLGFVMNEWNDWNQTGDRNSYKYDYSDNNGKGKMVLSKTPPVKLRS